MGTELAIVMGRTYLSFGKINLHLEVVGQREDGYHELRTIFQTVSLHDRIEVAACPRGIELMVSGESVPTDKVIPVGGGLGGGSSNAATVLLALRDLFGQPVEIEELVELAARLGADVPYFLVGGTALGTGRGDRVEPLPDLAEEEVLLVNPGISVSTAEVFGSGLLGRREEPHPAIDSVRAGRPGGPAALDAVNDLEPAVRRLYPEVDQVYNPLVQSGAERVRLSGSGATVFAFPRRRVDDAALISCLPVGSKVFRARTLSRASIAAQRVADSVEEP
jgi:4-diphosphocytidyl-2-C-methyl-D-erythritol kinase